MAIETTPLGFQKPDGTELVRDGDNVIAGNAQKAEDRFQEDRGRMTVIEAALWNRGNLVGGENANNMRFGGHHGSYRVADSTIAASITGLPEAVGGDLNVWYLRGGADGSAVIQQYLTEYGVDWRRRRDIVTGWTIWESTTMGPAWAPLRSVPANADMDTYRTPGLSRIRTPDTASIGHLPPGMRGAGIVQNLVTGDGTDTILAQVIHEQGTGGRLLWRAPQDDGALGPWSRADEANGPVTEWHVFLAAGQSNMAGRGIVGTSEAGRFMSKRIYQFGYVRRVHEMATVPLDMHDAATAPSQGLSPATTFSRSYLRSQAPHVGVLIIPAAHGGAGFTTSTTTQTWTPGITTDPFYDLPGAAVTQTLAAITAANATGASVVLKGILWHQGEANSTMSTATYATNLDALIAYFRTQLSAPNLPFLVGQMTPEGIAATTGRPNIDAAHQQTPARVPYTAFAPATAGGYNPGDTTHMSKLGVDFLGGSYAEAFRVVQANADLKPRLGAVEAKNTDQDGRLDKIDGMAPTWDVPGVSFAVVTKDGMPTWLQANDTTGGPTKEAEAAIRGAAGQTLSDAPGVSFAVTSTDGTPTWLQANDTDGGPTKEAERAVRGAAGQALSDTPGASILLTTANGNPTWLQANDTDGGPTPEALSFLNQNQMVAAAPEKTLPPERNFTISTYDGPRKLRSDQALIVGYGDSHMQGGAVPSTRWMSILGTTFPAANVVNRGSGGNTTDLVAIRAGAIRPRLTFAGGAIPASGPVDVTFTDPIAYRNTGGFTVTGTVAGVAGTLTRTDLYALTFTRTTAGSVVTTGPAEFVSDDYALYSGGVQIILAGRNDVADDVAHSNGSAPLSDSIDRAVSAHVAMVEAQSPVIKKTLILGALSDVGFVRGTVGYERVTGINQELQRIYPNYFWDLRGYLVNECIYDLGITPTSADLTAMAGDTLPPSIMLPDNIHFDVPAHAMVAEQVAAQLISRKLVNP